MRAMVLYASRVPLDLVDLPDPWPGPGQVRVHVLACAVCRTDLHVADGELPHAKRPVILGHEVVGVVDALGEGVSEPAVGTRVGIPWLGRTCGTCSFCRKGRENLCDAAEFTGYNRDGGYAEYAIAEAAYCLPLPSGLDDVHTAPLLCAGLIGYRALTMTGDAERIGIYGFGAAAHIITQVARFQGRRIYAFTRPGDTSAQGFARALGAEWAGGSEQAPPEPLDAAILFAPSGELVPRALAATTKGGTVVCGGIHMSDIPAMPYALLWGERVVRSVANLTRRDGAEFLAIAPQVPVKTEVHTYPLSQANDALDDLRCGRFTGAAVLVP